MIAMLCLKLKRVFCLFVFCQQILLEVVDLCQKNKENTSRSCKRYGMYPNFVENLSCVSCSRRSHGKIKTRLVKATNTWDRH